MRTDDRPARPLRLAMAGLGLVLAGSTAARGGPPGREAMGPYLDGRLPASSPVPSGGWTTVPAFPHLTFQDPTFLVPEPGGRRLYVGGRQGLIEAFEDDPNASTKSAVLDLRSRCQGWDDSGLMGLAFHPEFARPGSPNRGYFYVAYNHTDRPHPGPGRPDTGKVTTNRLARFTVPDGSAVADPNSELVLIDQLDENVWHNGGGIFFHPADGFLYLSLGDEGGAGYGNPQRIDRDLFSGVIRIDVDRRGGSVSHPIGRRPETGATDHYFIPNDNPWVGTPDALEEFWAIGLRSPHRMTVDPPTGRVWLGDVGEGTREEVDLVEKGANYQWPYREGSAGSASPPSPMIGRDAPPAHDYGRDQGYAVIGGYAYRGREHARDLGGRYVFGDNGGRVWALDYDPATRKSTVAHLCDLPQAPSRSYGVGLSSFGVDHDGELYLCRLGDRGAIFKLARTGASGDAWPRTLSRTGAFADLKALTPRDGLVPYAVNAPLWSDGAEKRRWIAVPRGEAVGFDPTGPWAFPAGTVFVKHFEIAVDESRPDAPRRRLETRFLVRDAAGSAFGATYRWRPDGSDADLLDAGQTEEVAIRTASGRRNQTWSYPSPRECLMCHTPASGYVLGVNTRQLNGPKAENPLLAWGRSGLFRTPPDEGQVDRYPRLVGLADPSASPEEKIRSYLDSNCAHCHRPDGVRARFDARHEAGPRLLALVDAPALIPMGRPGSRLVAPGDAAGSLLYRRMEGSDPSTRMPPMARNRRDEAALAVLRSWIESIPAGPRAPEVRLARVAPKVAAGSEVALSAEVGGEGVARVEFFRGDVPIGEARSAPYRVAWRASPEGSYLITARATDARGRSAASEGAIVTVTPPPPVEGPATYLDDLPFLSAANGFGPVERRASNGEAGNRDGRPIRLRGRAHERGLGVHAPSEVRVPLDGSPALFLADVGLDDETGGAGSVAFQVWADGAKLYDSGPMTGRSPTRHVRVDVTGRRELGLVVTDAGDGISSDHADWAGARLVPPPR